MIASEILRYYSEGKEEQRLTASLGRLERIRTWDIIERHLSPAQSRILDVGGGTGVYALPLARRGYQVRLVDPVPLHVERARALSFTSEAPLVSADVGDARGLDLPDASVDAVLLFGPLYHLNRPARSHQGSLGGAKSARAWRAASFGVHFSFRISV